MNKTKTKINTKVTSKTQGSENLPYYGYIKLYYLKQTALPSVNLSVNAKFQLKNKRENRDKWWTN
jgi:hypothetical protein